MVEKATAKPAGEVEAEEEEDDAAPAEKEPISRQRKADPFADAFEKAEAEIDGEPKPAKRAKAKPAEQDADEPDEDKPAKGDKRRQQVKESPKRKSEKADDAETDAGDEDDADADDEESGDEDDEAAAKPKGEAKDKQPSKEPQKKAGEEEPKSSEPLKPKAYWSKERREAFQYQPRAVQENWLAEAPVPHAHWADDQKSAFAALPREAQEVLLVQAQEIERGYGQKFQALANERKLAEGIRSAIPPQLRKTMEAKGLDELGVFATLLNYQQHAMRDPVGYVRNFIATNRIDPRHLFAQAQPGSGGSGASQAHQNGQPAQADFRSHPMFAAMMAEIAQLKDAVTYDRQQRAEDDDRRRNDELSQVLAEKDEGGNSRYPYIRILADPMAQIIESDPERYSSMGIPEQIADAYRRALEAYPELPPPPTTVTEPPPVTAETDDDEETDSKREAEAEKLKKASTKKSKTPQSAPATSGDPFARAFSRAERQLGHS